MIVNTAYDKTRMYPIGHGWDNRPKGYRPSSLVIHTTSNGRITSLQHELVYLRDSAGVSTTDVIPRSGSTVYVIVPAAQRAWHAGLCDPAFLNSRSVGIELHNSVSQKPTAQQIALLTHRVRQYIQEYSILKEMIETHRQVALPEGRKSDPAGWSDGEFYTWRDSLFMTTYTRVIGTRPTVTFNQFYEYQRRLKAPIDNVVSRRVYTWASDYDIDPWFINGLWKHETTQVPGVIGSSELYKKSFNAGAIKAYGTGWPSVSHNGARFNRYESPQLGLMGLVLHLKQRYGADMQLLDVETIIPVYAPRSDKNIPQAYINDLLRIHQEHLALPA